jgi:hypothetical protein
MNRRADGLLYLAPEWDAQKGRIGYERKLRYVFFDTGGHVAMCKRYRAYSQQIGLFKTLAQKRVENPNIDRLVGAANIWCRDRGIDPVAMVKEMQAAGISRILWSGAGSPESVKALNEMGVLTSRMDNYQDVRNPTMGTRGMSGFATNPSAGTPSGTNMPGYRPASILARAWPNDVVLDAQGDWIKGWESRPGVFFAVMCDVQGVKYADEIIGLDLQNTPVKCRFVDTTMCTAWHECYSPDHPMTRTQSRDARVELLRLVSGKYKLVCGSENGNDIAVPVADYFEGMLSIGPYRLPDSARSMQAIIEQVPDDVVKFQVSGKYRLPLWELVYHECALAHWYWGDYNNKAPSIWDQRDLINALYGTAPLFMFNRASWDANRERFVRSYQTTCPIARATGYSEMTDHRYLTADRSVQQTAFANGVSVIVNFGPEPYKAADGTIIAPKSVKALGLVESDRLKARRFAVGLPAELQANK